MQERRASGARSRRDCGHRGRRCGRRQRRQSLLQTLRHAVQRPAVRPDQKRALPAGHRAGDPPRGGRGRRHRREPQEADLREYGRGARPHRDLPLRGQCRLRRPPGSEHERRAPGPGPQDRAHAGRPPR
ncbi:MAG: hypothetical protein M0C28_03685 [Candidatus Moduliflexus flocculans]|nr:hypothetical protein [Candidatus Moduliflexus flocculans]